MTISPGVIVLALAVPILASLSRVLGPGRAALVGAIGGVLFLPRDNAMIGPFPLTKSSATGLGLLLGVLLFDRRVLQGVRPRARDLPLLFYLMLAPVGRLVGGASVGRDVWDMSIQRCLTVGVPYGLARLYLDGQLGARRLLAAIVAGGLIYAPLCLWEEVLGPNFYLANLLYGSGFGALQVERLGGYRPEVFLSSGLEVAAWVSLAAVGAVGMLLGRQRLRPQLPAGVPAAALLILSLSCRGVYGYVLVLLGLVALAVRWVTRSRIPLVLLALVPLLYITARVSGLWDGRALVELARVADRFTGGDRQASSVGFRIGAENAHLARINLDHAEPLGYGSYIWNGPGLPWPDGYWLHPLWSGGFLGLAAWLLALEMWPVVWAMADPPGGSKNLGAVIDARQTLALLLILAAIDALHNTTLAFPTALIAGCLIGGGGPSRETQLR